VAAELAAGTALLALALRHCLRARNPLLDPGLLRLRTFRVSLLTGGGLDTVGLTAVMFILPLMLQLGFGMTPPSRARSPSWPLSDRFRPACSCRGC